MVSGRLFHLPVILVCVYAPSFDDSPFMATLLSSLPNMDTHYLILGGDLNCVMNTRLDCSSPRVTGLSKMATTLQSFMGDYRSCDPWRSLHKDTRVYSFYSNVHHVYSRIDYFFYWWSTITICTCYWILSDSHIRPLLGLTRFQIWLPFGRNSTMETQYIAVVQWCFLLFHKRSYWKLSIF